MLDYLVQGRARRELFRLLWGQGASGNVSDLSRRARVTFSAAHRELEAMRAAGLAKAERTSTELVYQAETDHPQARLLRELAKVPVQARAEARTDHDDEVRAWLAAAEESPTPSGGGPGRGAGSVPPRRHCSACLTVGALASEGPAGSAAASWRGIAARRTRGSGLLPGVGRAAWWRPWARPGCSTAPRQTPDQGSAILCWTARPARSRGGPPEHAKGSAAVGLRDEHGPRQLQGDVREVRS